MFRAARTSTALATLVLAVAGCGGSDGDGASAPSAPSPQGPLAASGVTDGRTGPAVTATDARPLRELAPGGRPDSSEPSRRGGRREGIGAGDSCPEVDIAPESGNLGQIEAATLCLLNGVRADEGLQPVQLNSSLARAAAAHAADMVANSYFAHEGRDGSEIKDRIGATGYLPTNATWTIGENLAWGTGALATPKATMNAWMNSKGHRDNILAADYRDIGFGIVIGNPKAADGAGATYATAFGVRGGAAAHAPAGQAPVASKSAAQRQAASLKAKRARLARAKRASAKRAAAARAARS